jgi:ADP-ribose pyrophosphatase YjhB (NUDIX family)
MKANKAYYESLPKKRMGAGCLFWDARERVLLVKPTYKPTWEIPGGIVEFNESPKQCCQREVQEELGLARQIGALLVVDYSHQQKSKTESLMFIFDGGELTEKEINAIQLNTTELSEFGFFAQDALPAELTASLKARVLAAWQQKTTTGDVYLENQTNP